MFLLVPLYALVVQSWLVIRPQPRGGVEHCGRGARRIRTLARDVYRLSVFKSDVFNHLSIAPYCMAEQEGFEPSRDISRLTV